LITDDEVSQYIKLSWLTGDLSWKLHEKQFDIWDYLSNNDWKEALFFISRQFGKSFLSCCLALSYAIKKPGSVVRIAAPTLGQAYDIVNDQLRRISEDAPPGLIKRLKSDLRWSIGKSEIRIGTVARAHIDTLRGTNASLIILEEGGFVPSEDYQYAFRSVLVPQVTKTKGRLLHVTSPSEEPEHFIHTDVLPRCSASRTLFKYTINDNPFLSPQEIDTLADLVGGKQSMEWLREYMCQIVRDASVVCVPNMSQSIIKDVPILTSEDWYAVGDWGGVRDKTVILLSYIDKVTGRLKIARETVLGPNTRTELITKQAKLTESSINVTPIIRALDAPPQLVTDMNETHDYAAQTVSNKTEFLVAMNWLNVAIDNDVLEIDPSCEFTIKSMWGGIFNKNKTDFERTKELGHMDAIAALMYTVKTHMTHSPGFRYFNPDKSKKIQSANKIHRQQTQIFMADKFADRLPSRYA
jgi:hypothetical protein